MLWFHFKGAKSFYLKKKYAYVTIYLNTHKIDEPTRIIHSAQKLLKIHQF
jgi:hypothetical protein